MYVSIVSDILTSFSNILYVSRFSSSAKISLQLCYAIQSFFWTEWALGDLMALGVVISGDSVYCVCELSVQTQGLGTSRRLENALDVQGHCALKQGFMRTFPWNEDETVKLKSELIFIKLNSIFVLVLADHKPICFTLTIPSMCKP